MDDRDGAWESMVESEAVKAKGSSQDLVSLPCCLLWREQEATKWWEAEASRVGF